MPEDTAAWPAEFADRYRQAGYWNGENLSELLRAWARQYDGRTAVVHGERRLTFAELDHRVDRMAAGFRERGIAPGDRVVVQLPNVPEFVIVCFALMRAGALPVFALAAHRAQEIGHLVDLSDAAGYVVAATHLGFDYTGLALAVRGDGPHTRQVFVLGEEAPPGTVPLTAVDAEPLPLPVADPGGVAFFLLSGGTTALPKLIPRTHDDYAYQTRAAARLLGLTAEDVYLAVLPVEFNFAWGCPGVIGTLRSGGTVVLADSPTPDDCFALVERERVTFTSVVPTVAQLWLDAVPWNRADLSSLRLVQCGGARLQPELAARIGPALGCDLQQVFGMAEGLLCLTRPGDAAPTVLHTQGRPLSPADEIRIEDEHGRAVPPGRTGELLTRGPYTLRGYYRAAEHNLRAFTADGFYRTGDLARLTPDGDIVIEGRIKDVIIRGGDKISADEVEGHLLTHPAVARAAVLAHPDQYLGERTLACVVADGGPPDLLALRQHLRDRGLAEYKLPDKLALVESFPLTALGKVDKKALSRALRPTPDKD